MRRQTRTVLGQLRAGYIVPNDVVIDVIKKLKHDVFRERRRATDLLNQNHRLEDKIRALQDKVGIQEAIIARYRDLAGS